jgi:hypothetical protein
MINAVLFKKKNPNYIFLYLDEKSSKDNIEFSLSNNLNSKNNSSGNNRKIIKWKTSYTREELLLCSETIYGFCFNIKR